MSVVQHYKVFFWRSIVFVCLVFASTCFGQSKWDWMNPAPPEDELLSYVTYINNQFVAVGDNGRILTSTDGKTWSIKYTGTIYRINSVIYGNGKFVAVGNSGTILSSQDGNSWTIQDSAKFYYDNLYSVTYDGKQFVTVGSNANNSTILTSADGMAWTRQTSIATRALLSVTTGNGLLVAVGDSGKIITSPNATQWTLQNSNSISKLTSICYANNKFVAVGGQAVILTSLDGITWRWGGGTWQGASVRPSTLCYGNSKFVILSNTFTDSIITSTDDSTWTINKTGIRHTFESVSYGCSLFVAVSSEGAHGSLIFSSQDGITWTMLNSETNPSTINSVASTNSRIVAVRSSGNLLTSSDGTSWSLLNSGSTNHLRGVAIGNSQFVTVGDNGTILTSPDGLIWTIRVSGVSRGLYSVCYSNNQFVAVGSNGTILTSPDGTTWSQRTSGNTNDFFSVCFGENKFVAVGYSGTILYSLDGISWSKDSSGTTVALKSVAYGDSQFIAVGLNDTLLSSHDGIQWSKITQGNGLHFSAGSSVCYGNHSFVIVGQKILVLSNNDGITWKSINLLTRLPLTSVTYSSGKFIAVGGNGLILISQTDIPLNSSHRYVTNGIMWKCKVRATNCNITASLSNAACFNNFKVRIVNISGKSIYSGVVKANNGVLNIPAFNFSPGEYLMEIVDNKSTNLSSKFTITR